MIAIPLNSLCVSYCSSDKRNVGTPERRQSVEFMMKLLRLMKQRDSLSRDGHEVLVDQNLYADWKSYYISLKEFQTCFYSESEQSMSIPNYQLPWENSFNFDRVTNSDLRSELTCVLFTLAALHSQLAILQPTDDCTGLSKASEHFNLAAGILDLLLDQSQRNGETTNCSIDTSYDMLEFLKYLMLAQSQSSSFYCTKKLQPKLIHCLLTTVAMGCAELYRKALNFIDITPTHLAKSMKRGKFWENCIKAKHSHWLANAEYHKGAECWESAMNMGNDDLMRVAVGRIRAAEQHIAKALLHARDCDNDVTFRVEGLKETETLIVNLKEKILEQQQDSTMFSGKTLPQNLEAIYARIISKATLKSETDLLSTMSVDKIETPLTISSVLIEKHDERLYQMIQQTSELVRQKNFEAHTTLEHLCLPHALTKFMSASASDYCRLPDTVWRKLKKLQQKDQLSNLQERLLMLGAVAEFTRDRARELQETLDNDMKLDRDFRQTFPMFGGMKPSCVQPSIRRDLQLYLNKLENARQGDAVNFKMMESLQTDQKFMFLSMTKEEIESLLRSNNKNLLFDTTKLEHLLKELSNLIDKRNKLLLHLRFQENDKIEKQLSPTDVKKKLDEDLCRCKAIQDKIETNTREQKQLLNKIASEKDTFDSTLHLNHSMNHWQAIVQTVEEGLFAVSKASDQVEEGHEFYQSILHIIDGLQQEASELSVSMAVERYEFQDREKLMMQDIEDAKIAAKLTRVMQEEEMLRRDSELAAAVSNASSSNTAEVATSSLSPSHPVRHLGSTSCSNHLALDASSNSRKDNKPEAEKTDSVMEGSNAYSLDFDAWQQPKCSPSFLPEVPQSSHFEQSQTQVDDELVAQLVAMDFSVENAVQALARCDNKIERAINDLLSESNK